MKINEAGLAIIKEQEGLRLKAYLCPSGIPTIGFGHTGPETKLGQTITQHQAEVLLAHDLERFEEGVSLAAPTTSPNQFSSLVSFAFNVGLEALRKSTLLKKFRQGDLEGASKEFGKWVYGAGKQKLPGLIIRRELERQLFVRPEPGSQTPQ